jgi:hypothetical protein
MYIPAIRHILLAAQWLKIGDFIPVGKELGGAFALA